MAEKLLLIGGGGHCKSCIDVIQAEGRFEIAGIVGPGVKTESDGGPRFRGDDKATCGTGFSDRGPRFRGDDNSSGVNGYAVIGTDEELPELVKQYKNVLITVGQIQHPDARIRLFNLIRSLGGIFPVIISPNAYVSRNALIGAGTIVMHHAVVNTEAVIGQNCILNTGALVEHEATVGDHCHISTYAILNGQCRVGDRTFIGSRTVLSNNTTIADDTLISAGSVVLRSLEQPGTYIGNPLRKIR